MTTSRVLRCGLGIGALALTAPGALATGYDDEALWQADAGAFNLETFEGFGDLTEVPALPGLGIEFGLLNDGVHYPHAMSIFTTGGTSHSGTMVLVNRDVPQLPGFGPIVLLPEPGSYISAAGYWNTGGDDSTEIRFYDINDSLIEAWNTNTNSMVFAGIVSAVPAYRVEIDAGGIGNEYITIDDLQVTTRLVPGPGGFGMIATGALAGLRRRR